jgi:hypothetical protein
MPDVDQILADFIAEDRATGSADAQTFLARASPDQRLELSALIDGYLTRLPRRQFNPERFRASAAERTTDELERSLGGQAGTWPALLPRLRDRAGLKRTDLVAKLAAALGVADRSDKVATYYHQMEQGTLPGAGVSDRVLAALGGIVGEAAEVLRAAGQAVVPPSGGERPAEPAYARTASVAGEPALAEAREPESLAASEEDEVDQLFRGG